MRTRILVIFLILAGGVTAGLLVFSYGVPSSLFRGAVSDQRTPSEIHSELISSNTLYNQAVEAYNAGDPTQAAAVFRQALAVTTDPAQQATIKFRLATVLQNTGDYEQAVALYKSIAADEIHYNAWLRASAVQELGLMYYRYLDPRITKAIFADAPYKTLYADKNVGVSYRKLFEYAASMYPLAPSELKIARWYADQLLSPSTALKSDTAKQAQYMQTIKSDVLLADADIARIANEPTRVTTYMSDMLSRAKLVDAMTRLGDTSLGDAETSYKQLLGLYRTNNLSLQDGSARVYYAGYLAQTGGAGRVSDIHAVLMPLMGETPTSVPPSTLFKTYRPTKGVTKAMLLSVASIDSDFKALLKSNGWTEADFK